MSSKATFGGEPEDYLEVHRFLDASKLFYYHLKHRALLHHLLGIEYCEELFGVVVENQDGGMVPVREIAAQHIREDLNGHLPSANDWFSESEKQMVDSIVVPDFPDSDLEEHCLRPWLRSGLRSTLVITCSQFGVYLAHRLLGVEAAKALASVIPSTSQPKELLQELTLKQKWQYTPDRKAIARVNQLQRTN